MGEPDRKNVLMIGDTFEFDIQGGINAGLDTCWLNTHNKIIPEHPRPTYVVSSLKAIKNFCI
jgi:FMN phosphatase YigB (HAD superfamily)